MTRPNGPRTRFEGSAPILRVANMSASLRYYVEVLRFQNADWGFSAIPLVTICRILERVVPYFRDPMYSGLPR